MPSRWGTSWDMRCWGLLEVEWWSLLGLWWLVLLRLYLVRLGRRRQLTWLRLGVLLRLVPEQLAPVLLWWLHPYRLAWVHHRHGAVVLLVHELFYRLLLVRVLLFRRLRAVRALPFLAVLLRFSMPQQFFCFLSRLRHPYRLTLISREPVGQLLLDQPLPYRAWSCRPWPFTLQQFCPFQLYPQLLWRLAPRPPCSISPDVLFPLSPVLLGQLRHAQPLLARLLSYPFW